MNETNSQVPEVKEQEVATPTVVVQQQPPVVRQQDNSIEGFISQAIEKGLPIETIERFLAMRKEFRADQAREAYVRAMSKLQGELPTIKKLKANSGTSSKYAPLEDIVSQTKDVISRNNFSYNWDTLTENNVIKVVCKATHVDGHIETSTMVSDIAEGTKVNTAPQKSAITITYLKRYTLCNLFGIVVADEDMDARNEQSKPKLNPATNKKAHIISLLKKYGVADTRDADYVRDTIVDLTQLTPEEKNFDEIISRLSVLIEEKNEKQYADY